MATCSEPSAATPVEAAASVEDAPVSEDVSAEEAAGVVDVELPQVQAAEVLPTEDDHMILSIKNDGALFLDECPTSLADLDSVLRNVVVAQGKQLFLRADKAVQYGVVMEVMGRIRAVGITNLGMVAESRPGEAFDNAEQTPGMEPAAGAAPQ